MKKITFLALHLSYGGIEKCICDAANLLSKEYDVEILATYKMIEEPPFKLSNKVKVTYLTSVKPNKKELINALKHFRLISVVKESIKAIKILKLKKQTMIEALQKSNSDVYISSRDYFNFILGKYGKNLKIGWEHNHHHNNKRYYKHIMKSCKNLDKLICVSNDLYKFYTKLFINNKINCECVFIPNSISELPKKRSNLNINNLVSVGRLSPEKGFSDLIDVFNIINRKNYNIKLDIIGDGKEYDLILDKIHQNNLDKNVTMHGFQNPEYINKIYSKSSIYLMTSYTESFGLVLIEAMSNGVVPIAFDSAEGAREIIKNGHNGYLIENRDYEAMANKVIELTKNMNKLRVLSDNAYNTSKKYLNTNFKDKWIDLIEGE